MALCTAPTTPTESTPAEARSVEANDEVDDRARTTPTAA
jgi:hypothetical protein